MSCSRLICCFSSVAVVFVYIEFTSLNFSRAGLSVKSPEASLPNKAATSSILDEIQKLHFEMKEVRRGFLLNVVAFVLFNEMKK